LQPAPLTVEEQGDVLMNKTFKDYNEEKLEFLGMQTDLSHQTSPCANEKKIFLL
jgi:hypothetical protein